MPQQKHKYRVSLYLGKETYEEIEKLSDFLGLPVATTARVILETGLQISKSLERRAKENGNEQPEV